jgi:hypothetical protein
MSTKNLSHAESSTFRKFPKGLAYDTLATFTYLSFSRDHHCTSDTVDCTCCGAGGYTIHGCPHRRSRGSITCYNCGQEGHIARNCPTPKDWSKLTCRNCSQTGHTSKVKVFFKAFHTSGTDQCSAAPTLLPGKKIGESLRTLMRLTRVTLVLVVTQAWAVIAPATISLLLAVSTLTMDSPALSLVGED